MKKEILFSDLTPARVEGGLMVRSGKFFECGDYADKGFSLSEAEADAVLPKFTGGDLNVEHMPSVFDGKLGTVRKLWREGKDIHAEYAVPKWLHDVTEGKPLKISSEWDTQTKMPLGAALVLKPRVRDAAMMAAFSERAAEFAGTRHNTPEGQMLMQELHDATSRGGAVCDRGNTAKMASQHEATAVQKIHDMTTSHGATCKSGDKPAWAMSNYSTNDNDPAHSAQDGTQSATGAKTMLEKFKALFHKAGVPQADIDALTDADIPVTSDPQAAQEIADLKAKFSAAETDLAALRAERVKATQDKIASDAEAFYNAELAARRVFPAEKANLIAAFTQAAQDDAANPATVTFSTTDTDGKPADATGSRVDALKALQSARLPHGLTTEQLQTAAFNGGAILPADVPKDGSLLPETLNSLLESSPLGQAVLKANHTNGQSATTGAK